MWAVSVDSLSTYFGFKCASETIGLTDLATRLEVASTNADTIVPDGRAERAYIIGFSLEDFVDESQGFNPCGAYMVDGVEMILQVLRGENSRLCA